MFQSISGPTARLVVMALVAASGINTASATSGKLAGSECSNSNFSPTEPGGCVFGVSNTVANGATLRINTAVVGESTSRESRDTLEDEQVSLRQGVDGGVTGVAAGDDISGFGIWTSYSHSEFESDFVFAPATLAYDGESDSIFFGIDRMVDDRFLLGLAVGYEDTSSTTAFNGGGADTNGFTISPYAAWLINDIFSVDVAGGYGNLNTDQNRISTIDGTRIDASYDSRRLFFATNLSATVVRGDLVFGGQLGVLHTKERQDAFQETGSTATAAAKRGLWKVRERHISLTQFVASADVGYAIGGTGFEPYGRVGYRNDISRDNGVDALGLMPIFTQFQPDDDDEWEFGGGVRYFGDGISGAVDAFTTQGREAFDNWSILVNLRIDL